MPERRLVDEVPLNKESIANNGRENEDTKENLVKENTNNLVAEH